MLVDGDHDLLGDGSVELLLTPGHTPGHQSVRVGERLVIGGDVTHFASGLDDHRFPVFADDFDAQAASAERLRALRDAGADVRPGHDPGRARARPRAGLSFATESDARAHRRAHHGENHAVRLMCQAPTLNFAVDLQVTGASPCIQAPTMGSLEFHRSNSSFPLEYLK